MMWHRYFIKQKVTSWQQNIMVRKMLYKIYSLC